MSFTKKILRFTFFQSIFLVLGSFLFATDWPVKVNDSKTSVIKYNFAEERYGSFSPSLVFSVEESDVTSISDGKVIFVSDAKDSYYNQFSSPLGSFAIVAHPDKMVSVYANLSQINPALTSNPSLAQTSLDVSVGSAIGKVISDEKIKQLAKDEKTQSENLKNLGFHTKNETFEFQILDTQNKVSINSYLILPEMEKNVSVYPGSVYLENKRGVVYSLDERKVLPSGVYSLYRDFVPSKMPLSTSVSVNGKTVSKIDYDMLVSKNGVLLAGGNESFAFSRIFALSKKQFLGEVQFVRGKNEITMVVTDLNKNNRKMTYIVDMY